MLEDFIKKSEYLNKQETWVIHEKWKIWDSNYYKIENIQKVQRFSFENAHGLRIFQINFKPLSDLS